MPPDAGRRARPAPPSRWFVLAALAGGLHVAATLHWALGGTALLWTLGSAFVARFAPVIWVLYPVAAVKAAAAFGPLVLQRLRWPAARWTRPATWLAAVVLVAWGGANTVVANLVLWGVVRPPGGHDRSSMIGHGWIWDPLFLVWGVALAAGLLTTRRTTGGGSPTV